jgi:YggT family protein
MGGIDLSPLVLLLGIYAIRIVIANNMHLLV